MLKKIPHSLAPELVKTLMEMGNGDEILLCGRDYPAKGLGIQRVYYINTDVPSLISDILDLLPLSEDVAAATMYFEEDEESPLCAKYEKIIAATDEASKVAHIDRLDRYPFSNRAERVYCAVVTADGEKGCELILTKGRI